MSSMSYDEWRNQTMAEFLFVVSSIVWWVNILFMPMYPETIKSTMLFWTSLLLLLNSIQLLYYKEKYKGKVFRHI